MAALAETSAVPARGVPWLAPWVILAHVVGAAAIGALEAARLGSGSLAMTLVPVFAATGLAAGVTIAAVERASHGRPWWVTALIVGSPSLVVAVPVGQTLFDGAFAQTLPLAGALPFLVPLAVWLAVAAAVAVGRWLLRTPDLVSRAIAVCACAGAIGAIVWVQRRILGTGYPGAHVGATFAVIVIAGVLVRVTVRREGSAFLAAGVAALVVGTAAAATVDGLQAPADRRVLAARGALGIHLIRVWRLPFDRDGDGSARVLGGGDCDDDDPRRHPGAADLPGDRIDQDCDGTDAIPPPVAAQPAATDLAAWRASPEVRAVLERTRGMNVLLISIDALRLDVVAPDTADRAEFPHLTRWLDESVWFVRAIAPGAGTDVSIGTMLTGRTDPFQVVDTTLPEALGAAGLRTSSAIPIEVSRYVGETILNRGIDTPRPVRTDSGKADIGDHVTAEVTTAEGVRMFDEFGDARSFAWLHYFDVHEHHQIDVPARLLAAVSSAGGRKRHRYRALLFAIDEQLGRLRELLVARGLLDRTIVVVVSDHGESLGDDPRLGNTHGKVTYAPLVQIPLAIRIPGVPGGRRTDAATLVDLAPTLLGLLGEQARMAPLDGLDLVPVLLDAPAALRSSSRAIAIHEELQWSLVEWPYQLIVQPADDVVELYDLERDPKQQRDLSAAQPERVTRMRAQFAAGPAVKVDRTRAGRHARERLQPRPPRRAPP